MSSIIVKETEKNSSRNETILYTTMWFIATAILYVAVELGMIWVFDAMASKSGAPNVSVYIGLVLFSAFLVLFTLYLLIKKVREKTGRQCTSRQRVNTVKNIHNTA